MALLSWVPRSKAQNGRFFKVALFAQKMQADPNFLHHLEGPRGCFQNLKKKFEIFSKFWILGPKTQKCDLSSSQKTGRS